MKKKSKVFDTQFVVILTATIAFLFWIAWMHIEMYGIREGVRSFTLSVLKMLGTGLSVCILVSIAICLLGLGVMKLHEWKNERKHKELRIRTWEDLANLDRESKD